MSLKALSVQSKTPRLVKCRRRWPWYVAMLLFVCTLVVYFVPAIACHPAMRDRLLRLAVPESAGRVQVESIAAGWRTPIEARGIRYSCDSISLVAESARCDRTLLDLMREPTNLGCIRLASPELKVVAMTERKPVQSGSSPVSAPIAPVQAPKAHPVFCELHCAGGSLWVADSANHSTCIAREIECAMHAAPGSDCVSFRMSAYTGDPRATAHVSANGSADWPTDPARPRLREAHVEVVGIECEFVDRLLTLAGNARLCEEQSSQAGKLEVNGLTTGTADVQRTQNESLEVRANFEVHNFSLAESAAGWTLREPMLAFSAVGRLAYGAFDLEFLRIRTERIFLNAAGTVTDCFGKANADVGGVVCCDWQSLEQDLRRFCSEEFHIMGKERRPWHLRGLLRADSFADWLRIVEIDAATHIDSMNICGFDCGPIELSTHWQDGTLQFDPIQLPFQNGQIAFEPSLKIQHGVPVLTISAGRVVDGVAISPELCDGLLRYIDPLFTITGSLKGKLSLEIEHLEIPLECDGLNRGSLTGRMLLDDVDFALDEPLTEIIQLAGLTMHKTIHTSQMIDVRLHDGRVYHSGLAIPVGKDQLTLDGWVGLDHSLNVQLSLPVTEQMLGKDKRLYRLIRGRRIELPVTGTVEKPLVSEEAFAHNIQRLIQITLRDSLSGDDPLSGLLKKVMK